MSRLHQLLATTLLFPTLLIAQASTPAQAPPKSKASANQNWRAIHDSAIIIDTHADTPGRFVDENFDLAQDAGTGYMDFNEIKAGNLGAEFFSIWVEPKANKGNEAKRALDMIDSVYEQARRHPDKMMMAFSTQDILTAHRQHKFAALLGVEGGHAIEGDIRILRDYYRLGVRYMTLTWSNTNDIGDSSGDMDEKNIQHHGGFTPFGREVVTEMNRMGMMVDISHVADTTFYQALELSRAPVIASHSSSRALTNAPRNMTDDMLQGPGRQERRRPGEFLLRLHFAEVSPDRCESTGRAQHDPDYLKVQELFIKPTTPEVKQELAEAKARLASQAAASAAQRPHRPHRSHGEGCGRGPRRPGLRFRRHRLLAARASTRSPTCRKLPRRFTRAATRPPILIRFLAAICCGSSAKSEKVSGKGDSGSGSKIVARWIVTSGFSKRPHTGQSTIL